MGLKSGVCRMNQQHCRAAGIRNFEIRMLAALLLYDNCLHLQMLVSKNWKD